ncbi:hypothetical protein [Microvirga yunnanensis]|nr:hypothetical protein [Microvirga sp. HBU65207]
MDATHCRSSLTGMTARVGSRSRAFLMRLEAWIGTIERAINAAVHRAFL